MWFFFFIPKFYMWYHQWKLGSKLSIQSGNRFFCPEVRLYRRRTHSISKSIINALLLIQDDGHTCIGFIIMPYIFHLSNILYVFERVHFKRHRKNIQMYTVIVLMEECRIKEDMTVFSFPLVIPVKCLELVFSFSY